MILLNEFRARGRAMMRPDAAQSGFTLIELMVVIIIIAVLAAIAIPQFINQRTSAWDAETKSDLGTYVLVAGAYALDFNGNFGTSATPMSNAALVASPYKFAPSVDDPIANWTLTVSADRHSYTISTYNKNFTTTTGHIFTFDSATGKTTVS